MDFVTPLLGLIVPHLPALLNKAAEDVVGKGAKKVAFAGVPAGVKAIWAKLLPKVETDPDAKSAADKVAIDPKNAKRLTALEVAIEDLLTNLAKSEPEWVASFQDLLKSAEAESIASTIVNVDGSDNQTLVNVTAKNVVAKVEGGANFH
jgi:hypothetical protein